MEERNAWDQMIEEGEPDLWYGRFVKFMRLGTKRSIRSVFLKESKQKQAKASTNVGPGWCEAAKAWEWDKRARTYDEHIRAEEDRIIAEERDKVLRSGFALQHKRIQIYNRLADKLIGYARDESKVWLCETRTFKASHEGEEDTQIVEKVVFNAPLFQVIDRYLGAVAAEMGERVKKKDIAITELPPNIYLGFDPNKDGTEM
jgi:hypothetical protein